MCFPAQRRWKARQDWDPATEELQHNISRLPKGKQRGADGLQHGMCMPLMVEGEHYSDEAHIRRATEATAPEHRYLLRFDGSKQTPTRWVQRRSYS